MFALPEKIVTVPVALVLIALLRVTSPPVASPAVLFLPASSRMLLVVPVRAIARSTVKPPPINALTLPCP